MAQTQDQLKAKYQRALDVITQVNGSWKNVNMEGEKLFVRAEVANDQLKKKVWDVIKQIDASYSDLHADIIVNLALSTPASVATPAPASSPSKQTYKVQSGDTLSKIAQHVYGKASEYNKIFEANRDQLTDPDKIRAGMDLVIPA